MARARQRALTSISLSRSRAGLEWSSRYFANGFFSFAPFSYTRALESLTAVAPRLDRGSASFRPRLRLVYTAVAPRLDHGCASFRPRFVRGATAVKTQTQYTLSLICTVCTRSRTALRDPAHQLAVHMHIIISIIMVRSPILYGICYSATEQIFSTTTLHLLRQGFCTLVLFFHVVFWAYAAGFIYLGRLKAAAST